LKLGDSVSVLGPLGNCFELPPPGEMGILVAGGVGIPPMLYLAEKLKGRAIAFCGATTRDLLPFTFGELDHQPLWEPAPRVGEFARYNIGSVITTDDGTCGYAGYVTQALERYLDSLRQPPAPAPPFTLYTCGPELMMKRVAGIALSRHLPCQVAVERAMACGMGTCQSCCIRLKRDPKRDGQAFAGKDWIYKLACTDGPVFKGADLLW
jgi:dihydroorotate dehydrogenase electron transfer subunit